MRPPVLYYDDFIPDDMADEMMRNVWNHTPWEHREGAPRREYWLNPYAMPYTYGSGERARTYEGNRWNHSNTGVIANLMIPMIEGAVGPAPDCCFLNGYEDGQQHLGWHADDSPEMDHGHPIYVVSLGAAREIWVRPKTHKGEVPPEWRFTLAPGSLFVMRAGMQYSWHHRIPKADRECGPRVSFTYRRLTSASVLQHLQERALAR